MVVGEKGEQGRYISIQGEMIHEQRDWVGIMSGDDRGKQPQLTPCFRDHSHAS